MTVRANAIAFWTLTRLTKATATATPVAIANASMNAQANQ